MKRSFQLIAAAGLVGLMMCSCKNDAIRKNDDFSFKIIASVSDEKTYIEDGTLEEVPVLWGTNDRVVLGLYTNGNSLCGYATSDKNDAAVGKSEATFTFSGITWTGGHTTADLCVAFHPASSNLGGSNFLAYPLNMISEQNSTASSYDPNAFVMVAKSANYSEGMTTWKASFRRMSALNRYVLKNLPAGVNSVEITFAEKYVSGKRYFNLKEGESNPLPTQIEDENTKISVKYKSDLGANPAVYFCTWGNEIRSGETIKVVASSDTKIYTKTFTIPSGRTIYLKQGYLNKLNLDMSNASVSYNTPVFTPNTATQFVPGVANAFVIYGKFDKTIDDVRIKTTGDTKFCYAISSDLYRIYDDRIELYTSTSRIGQRLKYYLYRGTHEVMDANYAIEDDDQHRMLSEYYALGSNYTVGSANDYLTVIEPTGAQGYVKDANLRNQLKNDWGTGNNCGFNADGHFDVCNMLDVAWANTVTRAGGSDFAIKGGSFTTLAGLEAFSNSGFGDKTWGKTATSVTADFTNNTNLVTADMSGWSAKIIVTFGENNNVLKTIKVGKNMNGLIINAPSSVIEEIDLSASDAIVDLKIPETSALHNLKTLKMYQHKGWPNDPTLTALATSYNVNLAGLLKRDTAISAYSNLEVYVGYDLWKRGKDQPSGGAVSTWGYIDALKTAGASIFVCSEDSGNYGEVLWKY